MKNKKLLAFALSMAVAAGCTACGGGQASTDTSAAGSSGSTQAESSSTGDNTVIVAMGSGFSTLDPGYVYEKYPQLIVNACYENLFKFYENNGTPQPCLADTYEFSEDGLTLTVKLKDGLTTSTLPAPIPSQSVPSLPQAARTAPGPQVLNLTSSP